MKAAWTLPLSAVLAMAIWAPAALAVNVERNTLSHGVANCQSALPVFDGNIRKRPRGLGNEGSSAAFVTCDFESIPNSGGINTVAVLVINRSGAPATVSCSLVQVFGDTDYFPVSTKSKDLANGALGALSWFQADMAAPATSCMLPPGTEIVGTQFRYDENVGQ